MPTKRPFPIPPDLAHRLLRGETVTAIAEVYDVDRRVVARWTEAPEVVAELAELRRLAQEAVARQVPHLVTASLRVLGELIEDRNTPPAVRRQAASDILDRYGQATRSEVRVTEGRSPEELSKLAESLRQRAASLGGGDSDGEAE